MNPFMKLVRRAERLDNWGWFLLAVLFSFISWLLPAKYAFAKYDLEERSAKEKRIHARHQLYKQQKAHYKKKKRGNKRPLIQRILKPEFLQSNIGKASWYGNQFHGRKTASGIVFNEWGMTAAHRTLPFGTKLKVTNMRNGKSVIVTITDRGPFRINRILDLSKGAFSKIAPVKQGVAKITYEVISLGEER